MQKTGGKPRFMSNGKGFGSNTQFSQSKSEETKTEKPEEFKFEKKPRFE